VFVASLFRHFVARHAKAAERYFDQFIGRFSGLKRRIIGAMNSMISIKGLTKTYAGGFQALKDVCLEIDRGEIFALLGPNGAGKTTLINAVCGIVNPTTGEIFVNGFDTAAEYRKTRGIIGLVPQELPSESFETVWNTSPFSRGLFGKPANPEHLEKVLKSLSLWDRKDTISMELSGGMKRRVLIAKALAHEPEVLFLDEPTAGVDVELRQDMWNVVAALREEGVTVILTTHYIEEAEQLADRVGVINHGEIILVEDKEKLMRDLGKKQLVLNLQTPLTELPSQLTDYHLELSEDRRDLTYTYDTKRESTGITALLGDLRAADIHFNDLQTSQSSLEDIFVDLVNKGR
jgi:ABC-2 type transport system ATP-binding protein